MKRILTFLLAASIAVLSMGFTTLAGEKDMRAVWISTVYNSDLLKTKNNAEAQKAEITEKLDVLQQTGINTVVFQVRPKADALYASSINPWSDVLTGAQGQYPGYDPLQFMIDEADKRGMEVHAWLNPYRITTSGTDINVLAQNHPARLHPEWVIVYNNALYYNPELLEVKNHIRDTVIEIIQNYDVDGIHFDDYFYPSDYPLPLGEDKDGAVANQRREHVNEMVKMVHEAIKSSGKDVVFGISPMGIWKNNTTDIEGSATRGKESYYSVFADAKAWIDRELVDYIVPQLYWEQKNAAADYETLVKWWNDQVAGSNVKLYIGQGLYKDVVATEIDSQLAVNSKYANVDGSFFFSLKDIVENRADCRTKLTNYYASSSPQIQPPKGEENSPSGGQQTTDSNENNSGGTVSFRTKAIYNKSAVLLNGQSVDFEAYNIDGYNYFKLRDIAMSLSATKSRFDTAWDEESQAIDLITDKPYTAAGGEMSKGDGTDKTAVISSQALSLDGRSVSALAYNIGGNNYFKLRDLGEIIGFDVGWDEDKSIVSITAEE